MRDLSNTKSSDMCVLTPFLNSYWLLFTLV